MSVTVIYGATELHLPIEGKQIATVMPSLRDLLNNLVDGLVSKVDGKQVDFSHTLQPDDVLEFIQPEGRKEGIPRLLTEERIREEAEGFSKETLDLVLESVPHHDVTETGERLWLDNDVERWMLDFCSNTRIDDGKDKMLPPDSCQIGGKLFVGLTNLEWRLMEVLLGSKDRSVKKQDAIDYVYGHDADDKDNAITHVIKRLNKKIGEGRLTVNQLWVSLDRPLDVALLNS